jgi:hypothetical protein
MRLWLITTNDNLRALSLRQKGYEMVALPHAVSEARRRLEPSIPRLGAFGIPIVYELELEVSLEPGSAR